jgi:hypothetical protein
MIGDRVPNQTADSAIAEKRADNAATRRGIS